MLSLKTLKLAKSSKLNRDSVCLLIWFYFIQLGAQLLSRQTSLTEKQTGSSERLSRGLSVNNLARKLMLW